MWAFCLWGLLNRVRSICECVGLDRRFECVLVQSALFGPRAYDGRTVGYIALGDGLRVVDTGRDVGVSSADVGVCWFREFRLAARVRW